MRLLPPRAAALAATLALASGCARSLAPEDPAGDAAADARADATTADVAVRDAATADVAVSDAAGSDCLPAGSYVAWRWTGGETSSDESFRVDPCRTLTATRVVHGQPPPATCSVELLPCCVNSLGIVEVLLVRNDPEVQAALAAGPMLYGVDARPWDGAVFELEIDGRTITVGEDCPAGDAGSCVPIPPGVAAARDALNGLTQQERSALTCLSP